MSVLPRCRAERLRRLLRLSVLEDLRRRRRWEIVVAPRAAALARVDPDSRPGCGVIQE